MSTFVRVKDSQYNDDMVVNVDSISYIAVNSGHVLFNGTHGEHTGLVRFDRENIQKILDAIEVSNVSE